VARLKAMHERRLRLFCSSVSSMFDPYVGILVKLKANLVPVFVFNANYFYFLFKNKWLNVVASGFA
jgi:hypothetical protein